MVGLGILTLLMHPESFLALPSTVFDNSTVPAGLLRAHRVAEGVWGRLLVHSGEVVFVFEDHPDERIVVAEGGSVAIPPARLHHVELDQPATFAVEFHRAPSSPAPAATGRSWRAPRAATGR